MFGRRTQRARRSTVVLSICFVAVFALWIAVRPSNAAAPHRAAELTSTAPHQARHRTAARTHNVQPPQPKPSPTPAGTAP